MAMHPGILVAIALGATAAGLLILFAIGVVIYRRTARRSRWSPRAELRESSMNRSQPGARLDPDRDTSRPLCFSTHRQSSIFKRLGIFLHGHSALRSSRWPHVKLDKSARLEPHPPIPSILTRSPDLFGSTALA
jgi:hypothetical protein